MLIQIMKKYLSLIASVNHVMYILKFSVHFCDFAEFFGLNLRILLKFETCVYEVSANVDCFAVKKEQGISIHVTSNIIKRLIVIEYTIL